MASRWISNGAEVFSAVGTVGAFLLGFLLLRREHRREADRAEDDRRAQASQISAWVEAHRRPDGTREVAFHIHNASDKPGASARLPAVPVGRLRLLRIGRVGGCRGQSQACGSDAWSGWKPVA